MKMKNYLCLDIGGSKYIVGLISRDGHLEASRKGTWTELTRQGWRCVILIAIQMKGVRVFQPNWDTHPAFGEALIAAREAGVEIVAMDCDVSPGTVAIDAPVPVELASPGCRRG